MSRYLAFDLGAESGRATIGSLSDGRMTLEVIHRFPNGPVQLGETLYWDEPGLFREIKAGLAACGGEVDSIGIDSWGVDYGLLDRNGELLGNPVHYRDSRTTGMMARVFSRLAREEIYRCTGIQFMQLNTLYQLFSAVERNRPLVEQAACMLCMADLQNYFLCGEKAQEYTLATTTQMYDANRGAWAFEMLQRLGIPTHFLPRIVQPGTVVGRLRENLARESGLKSAAVIAPAAHDTAAAVAAVPAVGDDWLYLSSGTWSLLGVELPKPLITPESCEMNFTNEGGVNGSIRFLRNIMGLWLVQECRRTWEREGNRHDYAELTRLAEQARPFAAVVDPAHGDFLQPGDMPARIADFCRRTGQTPPASKGEIVRIALEGLALAYRQTVEAIAKLTRRTYRVLHIVGGGTQNRLLNRLAADATGLLVKTGPVEATALGNCLVQAMALGHIRNLAEVREVVRRSVDIETYEPCKERGVWEEAYDKFKRICAAGS